MLEAILKELIENIDTHATVRSNFIHDMEDRYVVHRYHFLPTFAQYITDHQIEDCVDLLYDYVAADVVDNGFLHIFK